MKRMFTFVLCCFVSFHRSDVHLLCDFILFFSSFLFFSSSPDLNPVPLSFVPSLGFPLSVSGIDRVSSGCREDWRTKGLNWCCSGIRQQGEELGNGHSYGGRLSHWGAGGIGDEPCGAARRGLSVHPSISR